MKLAPAITRTALTCALIVAPAVTGTAVSAALAAPTQGIVATYDSDANTDTPAPQPTQAPGTVQQGTTQQGTTQNPGLTQQQGTQQTPNQQPQPAQGSNIPSKPQLDVTTPGTDPLIKTDHSKDKGKWLPKWSDDESLKRGAESAHPAAALFSFITGWLLSLLIAVYALINMLGLFYVSVSIGFIRTILSGGMYGNGTGSQSGANSMGMGMGMGGNPNGGAKAQGGWLKGMRLVPATAIQAVEMAESGERGGPSGNQMGTMMPGGFGGAPQQVGGSAKPITPIRYYLQKQALELVFLGVAIVILVLSPVLFDTGIAFGNGISQIIYWLTSQIF
ncbi:MAG: hypothetical protein HXO64_06920 [Rothia mucilaginosa]|uniref:Uncharacterized protein n=1 Tax=Rothia mucilaginosa TaxID=43675 RepID=A0A930PV46_9MICC|nr:hypothetical protein [Rothia mucilaginosa]MBF1664265.1 hypothetical protein [Rothia mucilaginosa]